MANVKVGGLVYHTGMSVFLKGDLGDFFEDEHYVVKGGTEGKIVNFFAREDPGGRTSPMVTIRVPASRRKEFTCHEDHMAGIWLPPPRPAEKTNWHLLRENLYAG